MIFFETEAEKEERRKKKQNEKIIRDEMVRDIRTLFEQEKKRRLSNSWNNNYIEYKSNGDEEW